MQPPKEMSMQDTKVIPLIEPWIPPSYAEYVQHQILSGFIGPGPRTQEFSKELGAYVGAPHCLLTVSGTIALSVAARAIGLKAGDEILVPAYGVISTINAFASIGLEPRLVEIERSSGCMSPDRLIETITEKTRAVCFVNFSGYTGANLAAVKQICSERGLPLIEDAACALGHNYQGTYAGMFGTVGIYSFSVPKILSTGQGGALVTQNSSFFKKAAEFIDHGDLEWRKTNVNRDIGSNLRFNDILSALGLCQLKDIEERLERRRTTFQILKQELEDHLYCVPEKEAPLHNIVFTKHPEQLMEVLRNRGITTARPYRTLSSHPAYHKLAQSEYANADFWTHHAVYLPFGMALAPEDARYIAEVVKGSNIELLKCI